MFTLVYSTILFYIIVYYCFLDFILFRIIQYCFRLLLIIVLSKKYCAMNTIFWTLSWRRHRRYNCARALASGQAPDRHASAPCTRCFQPQMRSRGAPKRRGRKGEGPLAAAAAVEQVQEGRRRKPNQGPPDRPMGRVSAAGPPADLRPVVWADAEGQSGRPGRVGRRNRVAPNALGAPTKGPPTVPWAV